MTSRPELTLAFLTHYPGSAAEVLQELEPASAAAFLEDVPTRLAAAVVGRMAPWHGARTLRAMPPSQAAGILLQMPFYDGAGVMRLVPAEVREPLFDELPARRAHRLRRTLRFPAGSVGAWIDPDIPAFPRATTAAEALRYVEHSEDDSHVFIQDDDSGAFVGALPVGRLLKSKRSTTIGELALDRVLPVPARSSLASAAAHPDWDRYLVLPVTGRAQSMVGGLSRTSLVKGLAARRSNADSRRTSVLVEMLTLLGVVSGGLLKAVTDQARGLRD